MRPTAQADITECCLSHKYLLVVQVAILYALQKGFFRHSKPEDIQGELAEALCFLRRMHPTALAEITATQSMSEPVEAAMAGVLEVLGRMPTSPVAPVKP